MNSLYNQTQPAKGAWNKSYKTYFKKKKKKHKQVGLTVWLMSGK